MTNNIPGILFAMLMLIFTDAYSQGSDIILLNVFPVYVSHLGSVWNVIFQYIIYLSYIYHLDSEKYLLK